MGLGRQQLTYGLTLWLVATGCTDAGNGSILYCEVSEKVSDFSSDDCGDNKRSGDVELSPSAESSDLAGVTWIDGSLLIENVDDRLSELSMLSDVRCVERDVIVRNTDLSSLDALSELRYVGGNLIIGERDSGNRALASITGLSSLTAVDGYLWIQSNGKLTDLAGLSNLGFIGDMLAVVGNDSLTEISALSGLGHVGGFLNVVDNDNLPTCAAVALSEQLASECRNVCVRDNSPDSCPNEVELCWYEGVE